MAKEGALSERIAGCANPQIAGLLHEWMEQAAVRNDKLQFVYRRALTSVLAVEAPVVTFKELERLHGIGPNIRQRLEKSCKEAGVVQQPPQAKDVGEALTEPAEPTRKRQRTVKAKEYVPSFRSGPYAMLLALYIGTMQPGSRKDYLLRSEVVSLGQPYCLTPMEEGAFSPLQGAIKTLSKKALVSRQGVPARFRLTVEGAALAERLWNSGERRSSAPLPAVEDALLDGEPVAAAAAGGDSAIEHIRLPQDSFDVVLLVDTREIKSREERDFITNRLNDAGILSEQRSLELGDFVWIARARRGGDAPGEEEVLLDYIIERKREDDLIASIMDGRFKEQKFRLRTCGLQHCIYLVERCDSADFKMVTQERFDAAISQTQAVDGMHLRYTSGLEETLRFLITLSGTIADKTRAGPLLALAMLPPVRKDAYLSHIRAQAEQLAGPVHQTFGCYTQINSKSANLTSRDIFMKQLLAIRQLTADKATAIAAAFPSAVSLYTQYRQLGGDREREGFFKNWTAGDSQRKFGNALSRRIYLLFCSPSYEGVESL